MPNHVTNKLTLHCGPAEAANVFAEIGGPDEYGAERIINFNKLIPYPEVFAEADRKRWEWEKANPRGDWREAPKDGYNHGGYEWCVKNWGTKWNAYSQKRLSDTSISFDTAWSTPEPVYDALSTKYPGLSFGVEYADEDIGRNAGRMHYKNGKQGKLPDHDKPYDEAEGMTPTEVYFNLK